jgi:hypothetical protein
LILVDTSVWIDHLRSRDARLVTLLEADQVLVHPWVLGELALGTLADRERFLTLLSRLPSLRPEPDDRIFAFIDDKRLFGRGIGWVDTGLLAACASRPCRLLTHDRRLASVARALDLEAFSAD